MSIKYCGIFSNDKDFTCLGENDDGKFKKFVIKYQSAIVKEPLSKKIELNMGFSLVFLKFDNETKVICVVGNAKYHNTKSFIESVVDAITKLEIKLKDSSSSSKVNRLEEYSKIIELKIDLGLVDINETIKPGNDVFCAVNFHTTTNRKSINLEQEKEEYVKEKVKRDSIEDQNHTISSTMPNSNNFIKDNLTLGFTEPDVNYKRKNTRLSKRSICQVNEASAELATTNPAKAFSNQTKALPTPKNKNKLIEIINNDVNDLKATTKKNIMEVIKNQDDLNELLIKSNNIKVNAFEYKENAVELKKETKKALLIWSLIVGILVFIVVWVICSLVLCGNAFSPLCKV
jgi:hypothetical protein